MDEVEQREVLARLRRPVLLRWLAAVALDWGVIAAALAGAAWLRRPEGYVLAILVIGNRQHALAIIGHDGAHGAACRPRWLNDALTCLLCFWPLGLGLDGYRKHHYAHHRHTGTAADPELTYKSWGAPHWDLPASCNRRLALLLKDLCGLSPRELLNLRRTIPPLSGADFVGPLCWWAAAAVVLLLTGMGWALLAWGAALATSYWATFRYRVWTEHIGTPGTHRIQVTWWQRLLFAPHNTWCHWEHHRWPSLPSGSLPAARELVPGEAVVPLCQLLTEYRAAPRIPSGQPLREERTLRGATE
jgi:fatty acid desaturase